MSKSGIPGAISFVENQAIIFWPNPGFGEQTFDWFAFLVEFGFIIINLLLLLFIEFVRSKQNT